jgi:hypothetical protein
VSMSSPSSVLMCGECGSIRSYITGNSMTTLQNNTFAGLPALAGLYLNMDALQYVEPDTFAGLPRLLNLCVRAHGGAAARGMN